MTVYDRAQELALAIAQSEELKVMRQKTEIMMGNEQAQKLLQEYRDFREKFMSENTEIQDLAVDKQLELERLEEKMSRCKALIEYMAAEKEFERILRSVNVIISSALNSTQEVV